MMAHSDYNRLGIQAAMRGDHQSAEQHFHQALSTNPDNPGVVMNLCRLLQMQQRHSDVVALLKQRFHPDQYAQLPLQLNCMLAQSAASLSEDGLVIALLSPLDPVHHQHPEVALPLSQAYLHRGELELSSQVLLCSLQQNSSDPSLLTNLAIVVAERGDYVQAERLYRQVVHDHPRQFLGHFNLGQFLGLLGRVDEARESFNTCLRLVPQAPEAIRALSDLESASSPNMEGLHACYTAIERKDWNHASQCIQKFRKTIDPIRLHAAICELPHQYQAAFGDPFIYKPDRVVFTNQLFEPHDPILLSLSEEIRAKDSLVWNRAGKPTREGYQTHEILAENDSVPFTHLRSELYQLLHRYCSLHPELTKDLDLHQVSLSGWGVILSKGGFQKRHIHPEAVVSGVIYLEVPLEISSKITDEGNLLFSTFKPLSISPQNGLAVMFPSYLPHETVSLAVDSHRICIAFNFS